MGRPQSRHRAAGGPSLALSWNREDRAEHTDKRYRCQATCYRLSVRPGGLVMSTMLKLGTLA